MHHISQLSFIILIKWKFGERQRLFPNKFRAPIFAPAILFGTKFDFSSEHFRPISVKCQQESGTKIVSCYKPFFAHLIFCPTLQTVVILFTSFAGLNCRHFVFGLKKTKETVKWDLNLYLWVKQDFQFKFSLQEIWSRGLCVFLIC